ncbi:hypothetical protein DNU06_14415 [Putridiphycobacter roseus]|uniref:FAD-binding domain-containing protein n=1 Tax=Putridiphycobacter roseus TaxID=2219161 RepID=A0A2W1NA33_9FLAO|nr:tryptophan 7-halogenase [Putridiphycobacter roseus]PZE16155.1 hypothetical protein DNU06_14415 [Putridiphycobacter roseus]
MKEDKEIYDLIIIGAGVSSTFLCLSIYKINPSFKILILEKNETFPQKVGESLVDLTAVFVDSLDIKHLLKAHTKKTGVRFLFNESNQNDLSGIAEFASPTLPGLINGYHLDRSIFDQQMLDEVVSKGAVVYRPVNIIDTSFRDFENILKIKTGNVLKIVQSKWLVDGSGRNRFIANKLNWNFKNIPLKTGAITAHFKNIAPETTWDTKTNAYWDKNAVGLRKFSTTHLMRKSSWWWIIRLNETTTSIGVVFDKNKVHFNDYENYFIDQISTDAQLSIITKDASRSKINHVEALPYVCDKLYSKGIALIGDSGAFIDPLISPGMELIGQQSIWLAELLTEDKSNNKFKANAWKKYSKTFYKAYSSRLSIYVKAYDFMHSYDIFSAWLKQGNYIYFGWIVFPSVLFKNRLKEPLTFNLIERIGLKYFTKRFDKIIERRTAQKRISVIGKNEITYSSVRVPKNWRFIFVPIHLLFKSLWAYFKLELKELKFLFKP